MIDFAKKYEQEQELINVKITDIIENLITPLKLKMKNSKKHYKMHLIKMNY